MSSATRSGALVLVAALVLQLAFAASYVGALHAPTPHGVPVAVIGPARAAAQLDHLPGDPLDAHAVPSKAVGIHQVDQRTVYGVFDPQHNVLYVASAANRATAAALQTLSERLAAGRHQPAPKVVDLKPLPTDDPNGISAFYAVIAWVFGGYLGATVLGLVGSPRSRSRARAAQRLGGMVAYGVIAGLISLVLLRGAFGVLEGPFLTLWAIAALVIAASGAATIGLQAAAGTVGTGLAIVLFVIVGNAASGGPYARPLLPGFWRTIGGILPPGAGVDLTRNTEYFGGAHTAGALAVLAVWGLGGAAVGLALGGRVAPPTEAEAEAAAAAAL